MPQNLPVSRCGTFAESLRKSVSGLSRSVANFSYWVRISSAGRPRRELNYLEHNPTTFWENRGQTDEFPIFEMQKSGIHPSGPDFHLRLECVRPPSLHSPS